MFDFCKLGAIVMATSEDIAEEGFNDALTAFVSGLPPEYNIDRLEAAFKKEFGDSAIDSCDVRYHRERPDESRCLDS